MLAAPLDSAMAAPLDSGHGCPLRQRHGFPPRQRHGFPLRQRHGFPHNTVWSVEATRQLRRQRLLDIADGTKPRPEDGNGDEQAKWDDESDRAINYLIDSCEEEPQNQIGAALTAAEACED